MMSNRLSAFEQGIIDLALEAEKHQLMQTGSFARKRDELFQFIRDHRREERRAKAVLARRGDVSSVE